MPGTVLCLERGSPAGRGLLLGLAVGLLFTMLAAAQRIKAKGASTRLTRIAEDPSARDAGAAARQAKGKMNRGVDGLLATLTELERAFSTERAGDAASAVRDSRRQLRQNRASLIGQFDSLIAAL